MMKRFAILACMVVALLFAACAQAEYEVDFQFSLQEDGTAILWWIGIEIEGDEEIIEVTIPETFKHSGFENNYIETEYTVTWIMGEALQYCHDMDKLTIPATVRGFSTPLFTPAAWNVKEIVVSPENPVLEAVDNVLFDKVKHELLLYPGGLAAESYAVPEGTVSIGEYAFSDCYLKQVMLPDSLQSLGGYALGVIDEVVLSQDHPYLKLEKGVLFDKSGETLIRYNHSSKEKSYTIPKGTKFIGDGAFRNCYMTSVKFPEGIVSIGKEAFSGCNLKSVSLPSTVTYIGDGAFRGNEEMQSLKLPKALEYIGESAFCFCEKLTSVALPDSVTYIGEGAFSGCEKLKKINIPKNLKELGGQVFNRTQFAASTKTLTLPENLQIDSGAFMHYFTALQKVVLPKSMTVIPASAFSGCSKLQEVVWPEKVERIEGYAFSGCTSLKEVVFPEGVKTIDHDAFRDCTKLEKVKLPATVEQVSEEVFAGCTALKQVEIPQSASLDWDLFDGCTSLKKVILYGDADYIDWWPETFEEHLILCVKEGSAADLWAQRYGFTCEYITD